MYVFPKEEIPEVKVIVPDVYKDERGYFFESFNEKSFKKNVDKNLHKFVQDNQSYSVYGTMRGLHWQRGEHAQAKLVRVVRGAVVDYAVDIRVGSPTFGKFVSELLTEGNHHQLYIPRGFAHGFVVVSADAIFQYKCDNYYNKDSEFGMSWNSIPHWNDGPNGTLYINEDDVIKSEKDLSFKRLSEISYDNLFVY